MKILKIVLLAFFFQFLFLINPYKVIAQPPFEDDACGFKVECIDPVDCTMTPGGKDILRDTNKVKFSFNLKKITADHPDFWTSYADYDPANQNPDILDKNLLSAPFNFFYCNDRSHNEKTTSDIIEDERPYRFGDCTFRDTTTGDDDPGDPGRKKFYLRAKFLDQPGFDLCVGNYSIVVKPIDVTIEVISTNGLYNLESEWEIKITFADKSQIPFGYSFFLDNVVLHAGSGEIKDSGNMTETISNPNIRFILKPLLEGKHTLELNKAIIGKDVFASKGFEVHPMNTYFCDPPNSCTLKADCKYPVAPGEGICQVKQACCKPEPSPTPTINPYCKICGGAGNQAYPCEHEKCATCPQCGYIPPSIQPLPSLKPLCEQLKDDNNNFQVECKKCIDKGEIWTAVGCISTDLGEFVNKFLYGIGLQFAGAVAFLYFLYGAFLYLTSGGNPEKVAMAKEIIVSSLSGLLLLIFSLFLLKIIAIDILGIPDFVP